MRSAHDPVDWDLQRVLVTGVTGSGKSTLAAAIAAATGLAHTEMDALHWGAGWTERASFRAEAMALADSSAWVTELQYQSKLGDLFVDRADTLVWLDLPARVSLARLVRRTLSRRFRRERVWGAVVERPLWTIFTDRDHIVRWWWKTRNSPAQRVPAIEARCPQLHVVRLRSSREVAGWLAALE